MIAACVATGAWLVHGSRQAAFPTASEATILADRPAAPWTVFRFDQDNQVLVLDFSDLLTQGRMLNRVAALTEKLNAPRDRLLDGTELRALIAASGSTEETFYYGHDYSAAELARFFALADRDHVVLDPEERALRTLLAGQGWLQPGAVGAVISIPATDDGSHVTLRMRAAILHHELAHGAYFTRPEYADGIRRFWRQGLDDGERAAFVKFLRDDGYDPALHDLTINEMQAYVGFTTDPDFFSAQLLGLPEPELEDLRARLLASIAPGWPHPPAD